jgi:ubiquinone/menaquinone biosynthesis C-methylase UbiE
VEEKLMLPASYCSDLFTPANQQQEADRLQGQTALESIDRQLWQNADLSAGSRVLDLGCGWGRLADRVAQEFPQVQVLGMDPSATAIARAQSMAKEVANLEFKQGTLADLHEESKFDLIMMRAVLQHLPQPITILKVVRECLRPGGQVSLLDRDAHWFTLYPEPPALDPLQQAIAQWQQAQGGDPQVGRKLGSYLQQADFERIRVTVETATSDVYGLETLLSWLSFGQPYGQFSPEIASLSATARQQAWDLVSLPYAWAGLGLFIATAHAPA